MRERLRVAIVGAGMMGAVHTRAARLAGAEIMGIAASTAHSAQQAARKLRLPVAYESPEEALLDPRVNVVHICTPNTTHYRFSLKALEAGKHVICEKPLAMSLAEARQLAQAARERDRVATVPFVYRYHPMVREARALVSSGELGALHLIHGSYLQDWLLDATTTNWRVDATAGGASRAFADIGSHWCDLIEWITGERFESVVASLQTTVPMRPGGSRPTFFPGDPQHGTDRSDSALVAVTTEDVVGALMRTDRGTLATLTVSQVSAARKNRLWFELDGAYRSVVFDQEEPERLWVGDSHETRLLVRDPSRGSSEQRRLATLPAGHAQGYAQCFEAFVADTYTAILGATPNGLPTFADGARSASIVEAVLASSETNSWTKIALHE